MSDDEMRRLGHEEEPDDVDAHSRRASANEEPAAEAEGESDDEVEGHAHKKV